VLCFCLCVIHRQGYREVKLHVILVGVMGTIHKDHTDNPLVDQFRLPQVIKLTQSLNEHSIRHAPTLTRKKMHSGAAIELIEQSRCGSGCHGTQPP
jgi:hypothetical protein